MKNKKPKSPKKRISKEVSRINREEQIKSGAKLTTRVVPSKRKYSRKQRTGGNNDLSNFGQE